MQTHDLKIWAEWFDAVRNGTMTFQVRKDDKNYRVGDMLILEEFRPGVGEFTGRKIERRVSYVLRSDGRVLGGALDGLAPGYCVLGIIPQ